jgi:chromosome segregation ATPase
MQSEALNTENHELRQLRDAIKADRKRLETRCTELEAQRSGVKATLSLVMQSHLEQGNARLRYLKARLEDAEGRVLLLKGKVYLQTTAAKRQGNTIADRQNTHRPRRYG